MAIKFAAVFFVAFAFHAALAKPAQDTTKNQLQELANQVQTVANEISTNLQKNLPDTKQVTTEITNQAKQFSGNVENIVNKLQTEINKHKGDNEALLSKVAGELSKTITNLQQLSGPEATAKANDLKAQFDTNVKNAAAQLEKLGKDVQPSLEKAQDTVTNFTQGLLNDFLKAAQDLQTQVQNTVGKH